MTYGVFIHKVDSIYDDIPSQQYQFPKQYLSRALKFVNDWIVYYEPRGVKNTKGYYAIAKVQQIIPDPAHTDMFIAIIEPGSYLDFGRYVQFREDGKVLESGLLNQEGKISRRAQWAIRDISPHDFDLILSKGLETEALPREDDDAFNMAEATPPIFGMPERPRVETFTNRLYRDKNFRKIVLDAYDETCAVTGIRLINGGGRAEAEAAHIKPVEAHGPDIVSNGIALCGTAHWMFDRGLIGLSDNLEILISRQANDYETIQSMINNTGHIMRTKRSSDRPHPEFIRWHRDHCFKQ